MLSATATGNAAAHVDTYTPPIGHDRPQEQAVVEVACSGGQGRTGTALARLAVLDGDRLPWAGLAPSRPGG